MSRYSRLESLPLIIVSFLIGLELLAGLIIIMYVLVNL